MPTGLKSPRAGAIRVAKTAAVRKHKHRIEKELRPVVENIHDTSLSGIGGDLGEKKDLSLRDSQGVVRFRAC
jgi:hypothetical protein